jgi:putative ABC transport system permease protein
MRDDFRDAWRGLRTAPATTALAVGILTLGVAAATVTFSVVDVVALRRMPFPEAHRLAAIARIDQGSPRLNVVAPQDFFTWQAQVPAFEGVAAIGPWSLSLTTNGQTERLTTWRITANLFDVLRVRPALGGTFTPDHERIGSDQVAILSHGFWVRQFGGDRNIVGRPVVFGKETRQIIGVMGEGFTYPVGPERATDVWVPHVPRATDREHSSPGRSYYLQVIGRLRRGATLEHAREQVAAATAAVVAAHPQQTFWKDSRAVVTTLHDYVVGPAGRWLLLVLGAAALVLVVANVNVANLLLARATSRARELALRTALGASRFRILRMLILESLMLSLAAVAFGLALAKWGVSIATANLPAGLARASAISLDPRVITVAVAAAILTGLIAGTVPAWHGSRADVMSIVKEGGGALGAGRRRARWQRVLLVAEVAFVSILLVATTLFVSSFVNVIRADLGFARRELVGFRVSKSFAALPAAEQPQAGDAFVADVLSRAGAVPGVAGAALVDGGLPLYGMMASYSIKIPGYGDTKGADMLVLRSVTPTYFDVTGIRVVSGRPFEDGDRRGGALVAILNEEAARRFFAGRNPVGETIQFRGPTTIVGVARSTRFQGPEVDVRAELYVPLSQESTGGKSISADLVVRLAVPPSGPMTQIQDALKSLLGSAQPPTPRIVDEQFRTLTAERRFNAGMMSAFGMLALAMGAAGIYGLMSFVVAQQTRSFGVRFALGATASHILRSVLADAARLLGASLAIGLFGGWVASRLFTSVIFGITGNELWIFGTVAGTLAATGLLAAWLPARRAARVDPLIALRSN